MRLTSLLVTVTVACWALPAHADTKSYEREMRANRARLVELNDMLKAAMAMTPDAFDDVAAIHKAAEKMEKLVETVRNELKSEKLQTTPGPAYGTLQNNLRKVEARVTGVQLAERTARAVAKLEPVAAAHGEAAPADLAEAARLVAAIRDYWGELPVAAKTLPNRYDRVLAKLAETPWPTELRPIEIDRSELEAHVLPFNATVEGKREMTIAVLHVTSPMRELYRRGGGHRGVTYSLWGPVTEKDGVVTGETKSRAWDNLEPGTYLIRAKGSGATTSVRLVLSMKGTPIDRFMQVGEIAADAPLAQRRLDAIFPFLGDMAHWHTRQKVFLRAPREAFVYARETLRDEDIETGMSGIYPQADEPLLVVGEGEYSRGMRVINAEGFAWTLRDTKLLATRPTAAPALPPAIHPLDLSYETDELKDPDTFETDAQAPIVKKYLASIESWNTCVDKVLDKYGGAAANDYDVVTYRAGKIVKVEGMADKAWNEADRTCKTKKVQAGWETFNKKLSAAQNADRARHLDEIKQAWAN
jgi:hypothetical protein